MREDPTFVPRIARSIKRGSASPIPSDIRRKIIREAYPEMEKTPIVTRFLRSTCAGDTQGALRHLLVGNSPITDEERDTSLDKRVLLFPKDSILKGLKCSLDNRHIDTFLNIIAWILSNVTINQDVVYILSSAVIMAIRAGNFILPNRIIRFLDVLDKENILFDIGYAMGKEDIPIYDLWYNEVFHPETDLSLNQGWIVGSLDSGHFESALQAVNRLRPHLPKYKFTILEHRRRNQHQNDPLYRQIIIKALSV